MGTQSVQLHSTLWREENRNYFMAPKWLRNLQVVARNGKLKYPTKLGNFAT